jgi:RimJ/RimL family protein N-acetyltransferase
MARFGPQLNRRGHAGSRDPALDRVPAPYGEVDPRAFLLHRYDAIRAGVSAPLAIVAADDDQRLLGSISLLRFAWDHARAEVGYLLTANARGRGHATRAVRLTERAGFTREALLRSYQQTAAGRQDMIAFGLLASR